MASEVARHYLRRYPREAARVIESSRAEGIRQFIDTLSDEDRALALSNLLPQTAATYLTALDAEDAADIIERMRAADAAHMLGTLTQTSRRPILDALAEEKRANIRHLLRYPDDSVGALMLSRTLACRDDADVRRAKQLVRRLSHTELPIMVVLDDAMRPTGLIAVSKLLSIREREAVHDHMRAIPARLPVYAAVRTVLTATAWNTEDHLPVVDANGRYVGLLPKARLHRHALAAEVNSEGTHDLQTTMLALADMMWGPAAEVLARVTTAPVEEQHHD